MNRPAHEWMCARTNGYFNMPPVHPFYQYRQPNTMRPWVWQRRKNEAIAGPFFLNRALGMRAPQQRNAKNGETRNHRMGGKTNRLGGPKGGSGGAIAGM